MVGDDALLTPTNSSCVMHAVCCCWWCRHVLLPVSRRFSVFKFVSSLPPACGAGRLTAASSSSLELTPRRRRPRPAAGGRLHHGHHDGDVVRLAPPILHPVLHRRHRERRHRPRVRAPDLRRVRDALRRALRRSPPAELLVDDAADLVVEDVVPNAVRRQQLRGAGSLSARERAIASTQKPRLLVARSGTSHTEVIPHPQEAAVRERTIMSPFWTGTSNRSAE